MHKTVYEAKHHQQKLTKKFSAVKRLKKNFKRHVDEYSLVMRKESPAKKCLSAFLPKPSKIAVDIQADDEQIILLLRQHLNTQIKWVLTLLIMIILPFFLSLTPSMSFLPLTYKFASVFGWYLVVIGFAFQSYLKWFYRVYLITDERIIDVDFHSMIYKDISTTKIEKIEDITALTSGFLSSVFNYGTIVVQTAATKQEFSFKNIPQPSKVSALLNEMILEEELEKIEGRVK